jgi:hypothetical protein
MTSIFSSHDTGNRADFENIKEASRKKSLGELFEIKTFDDFEYDKNRNSVSANYSFRLKQGDSAMRKCLVLLVFVAVFAGCMSQTAGEEGGWDPTGRVRVNGLYKWVLFYPKTGDTDRTFCRFYRFRNDMTYEESEVSQSSFYTLPLDTTAPFVISWQSRGIFSVSTDTIFMHSNQIRLMGDDNQFEPWQPRLTNALDTTNTGAIDGLTDDAPYQVFTSALWISHMLYRREGRRVVDSFYTITKRIGDEDMEIPLAELRR